MALDWQSHSPRQVGVYAVCIEMPSGARYWCKAFWSELQDQWTMISEPLRGDVIAHAIVELP
jgi:hypothetical protein